VENTAMRKLKYQRKRGKKGIEIMTSKRGKYLPTKFEAKVWFGFNRFPPMHFPENR